MTLGMQVGLCHTVLDGDPTPPWKGAQQPTLLKFTGAGWIKMPFGTEVGLGPHWPAPPPKRGTAAPQFSAHVYCGQHG